jgi:hypothetical protein
MVAYLRTESQLPPEFVRTKSTLVQLSREERPCIISCGQPFEVVMTGLVTHWRAGVALVAIYALILQALLNGVMLTAHAGSNPDESLSAVICSAPAHPHTQGDAPGAPTGHSDGGCCTLCPVSGLGVVNADIRAERPDYQSSRSSPLAAWGEADAFRAVELSPINPRAPPHLI